MKTSFHPIILVGLLTVFGCATATRMNGISVGMTKQEVIRAMGEPSSTAAPGGDYEVLRYRLTPDHAHAIRFITEEYFVKLVDGKVTSFGKVGDFDSAKDPTLNINMQNR
jgi:hypothetical protein